MKLAAHRYQVNRLNNLLHFLDQTQLCVFMGSLCADCSG